MLYLVSGCTYCFICISSLCGTIQWYRNGTLLDPASDDQYSVTSDSSQSVLTIHSFKKELMGRYEIVVSMEGQNSSSGVSVLFPGEGGIQEGWVGGSTCRK